MLAEAMLAEAMLAVGGSWHNPGMWIKPVRERDMTLVNRAVVQTTTKATYMSVQDQNGVILGTAKWSGSPNRDAITTLLREAGLYPDKEWRRPRAGVFVAYVRDVK